MKLFDKLLENPAIKTSYVTAVFTAVDTTVNVLNKVMPHLLAVQGIDPNARPGSALAKLFNKAFETKHEEDFDEDFNFGPALKAFDKTAKKLSHLNLTTSQFKELTDLDNLTTKNVSPSIVEVPAAAKVSTNTIELLNRLKLQKDENKKSSAILNEMTEFVDKYNVTSPTSEIDLLKALSTLGNISAQLGERKSARLADDFVKSSEQRKLDEVSLKKHRETHQAERERVKKTHKGAFKRSDKE